MKKHRPYKAATNDFSPTDLPKNRKEVFLDRVKHRYLTFLGIGALLFLFFLPYLSLHLYADLEYNDLYTALMKGSLEQAAYSQKLFSTKNSFNIMNVLWLAIAGVGVSGASRIIRHLAYDEPIFFWQDFFVGIKQNGLMYSLAFAFFGLLYFLADFSSYYAGSFSSLVKGVALGFLAFFVLPLFLFVLAEGVVYTMKIKDYFHNAVIFFMNGIWLSLLFTSLLVLPFLSELIPNYLAKYIVLAFLIIAFVPLATFAFFLFASSLMDRYVNLQHHPEMVNKGFYPPDSK